jgi:hypothetical protein
MPYNGEEAHASSLFFVLNFLRIDYNCALRPRIIWLH